MNYIEKLKSDFPTVYRILKNSFDMEKMVHSFIFYGEESVDPKIAAYSLISILISKGKVFEKNYEQPNISAYPDLTIVNGEEEKLTKEHILKAIEKIQIKALTDIGIKIFCIFNLEKASIQSLNSLLKTLEEPPENTFIIMTSKNIMMVPHVIKSRSLAIAINSTGVESVKTSLIKSGVKDDIANVMSTFDMSFTQKIELYNNDFESLYDKVMEGLAQSLNYGESFLTYFYNLINKKNAEQIVRIFISFFKDVIKHKNNLSISNIKYKDLVDKYSYSDFSINQIFIHINDFLKKLRTNTNFNLNKNDMLLKIKEVLCQN